MCFLGANMEKRLKASMFNVTKVVKKTKTTAQIMKQAPFGMKPNYPFIFTTHS